MKLFPGIEPLHKTLALKLAPVCGIQCLFLCLQTFVKFIFFSELDMKHTKIFFGISLNFTVLGIEIPAYFLIKRGAFFYITGNSIPIHYPITINYKCLKTLYATLLLDGNVHHLLEIIQFAFDLILCRKRTGIVITSSSFITL